MSRSGNVGDNAAMESFFSSLKAERTACKTYRTTQDAKAAVFDYIEPKRRNRLQEPHGVREASGFSLTAVDETKCRPVLDAGITDTGRPIGLCQTYDDRSAHSRT
jgi:transposase InsO family protein